MVDFGGWDMPIQYASIIKEHKRVRSDVGLFDVSHMGEIEVSGPDAYKLVDLLIPRKLEKLQDGQIIYAPLCQHDGGVVDDVLVHRFCSDRFLFVVNAANKDKDFAWLKRIRDEHVPDANVMDLSDQVAQLAVQGPNAENLLKKLFSWPLEDIPYYWFKEFRHMDAKVMVSRTGYTGEDGFELYFHPRVAQYYWDRLVKEGGIMPIGLGARDSLRLEAGMALYGNDIDEDHYPIQSIGWAVSLKKPEYIGREALVKAKAIGITLRLKGFEMLEKAIPRHGMELVAGEYHGTVTSGSFSPTLKKGIGMGYMPTSFKVGDTVEIIISSKPHAAQVVKIPFYKRKEN